MTNVILTIKRGYILQGCQIQVSLSISSYFSILFLFIIFFDKNIVLNILYCKKLYKLKIISFSVLTRLLRLSLILYTLITGFIRNMSTQIDSQKISAHYESFINDTLKEDLKTTDTRLRDINGEIAEFTQIKKTLEFLQEKSNFKNSIKSQVNVGCNFFIEAKVKDDSTMLFNVGLNHYLEFTNGEAIKYVDARIEALERASKTLRTKSAKTKAHIKLMLFHIGELQNINKSDL